MRLVDSHTGMETLDLQTCLELLGSQDVGRLGFLSAGGPEILPVNYALDGGAVVFATATGTKLWGVVRSSVVFEIDHTDPGTRSGWSVIVHGNAQEVTAADSSALRERIRALRIEPWAAGDKPHLVRIAPRYITGRRIPPHSDAEEHR